MASSAHNFQSGPSNSLTNKESFNQTTYKQNNEAGKMGRRKVNHRAPPFTTHSPKKKQPSASQYQRSTLTKTAEAKTKNTTGTQTPADWGDNTECSICKDTMHYHRRRDRRICILECHHLFHADCIIPWLQSSGTCPTCRADQAHETISYITSNTPSYPANNTASTAIVISDDEDDIVISDDEDSSDHL